MLAAWPLQSSSFQMHRLHRYLTGSAQGFGDDVAKFAAAAQWHDRRLGAQAPNPNRRRDGRRPRPGRRRCVRAGLLCRRRRGKHPPRRAAGVTGRAQRRAQERMDRVLVPAEDRSAPQATRRRRGARALPASAKRHPAAGRVPARRDRGRPDIAVGARIGECAHGQRAAGPAWLEHAVRRQHPGQRAGEAVDPRPGAGRIVRNPINGPG